MRKKSKEASEEDYDRLRAKVTCLRKELRQEKMRAEALDTMIDVAEETRLFHLTLALFGNCLNKLHLPKSNLWNL